MCLHWRGAVTVCSCCPMEAAVAPDLHRTNFQFVRLAPVRAGELEEHLFAPVALLTGPELKVDVARPWPISTCARVAHTSAVGLSCRARRGPECCAG